MEEALLLARIQFGLNIAFHILFPAITIGLAWLLVVFRVRYERTRDPAWLGAYKTTRPRRRPAPNWGL